VGSRGYVYRLWGLSGRVTVSVSIAHVVLFVVVLQTMQIA